MYDNLVKEAQANVTPDWTMQELEKVLKQLKQRNHGTLFVF